jgi:hypothetical protein
MSMMEAELTALDLATVEDDWLPKLLMNLPIVEKTLLAIFMNCYNQTVIVKVDTSKDDVKSIRHIKRWLNSIKKIKNYWVIILDYITEKNITNPFNMVLSRNVIHVASKQMSLRPT